MNTATLKAVERTEKPKEIRKAGFIPGILNGPETVSVPVKFRSAELNRIITKHGMNAKTWVTYGSEKKFGLIKEVQKHPVDGQIIHVDIQLIATDQEIKMQVPIHFQGSEVLEQKRMQVQILKQEVEVEGEAAKIPEFITVDVGEMTSGENITLANFDFPKTIKILDQEDEIYAMIKDVREIVVEEEAEEETGNEEVAEEA